VHHLRAKSSRLESYPVSCRPCFINDRGMQIKWRSREGCRIELSPSPKAALVFLKDGVCPWSAFVVFLCKCVHFTGGTPLHALANVYVSVHVGWYLWLC
jgi:hypothetical protein